MNEVYMRKIHEHTPNSRHQKANALRSEQSTGARQNLREAACKPSPRSQACPSRSSALLSCRERMST